MEHFEGLWGCCFFYGDYYICWVRNLVASFLVIRTSM